MPIDSLSMGACVSVPSGDKTLPNPGRDGPWKIGIVTIGLSTTNDCYITRDVANGPKWLYLRREATRTSATSYFLESFVPDLGRFPDAKGWKRGNGTVLCAAKANELGPSCFTMEGWPLSNVVGPGQYPDAGYTSDDGELRKRLEAHPTIMQRCRWTLKAEAYIYDDAGMRQQAGTLHMTAFGKQFRQLWYHNGDNGPSGVHRLLYRKLSGIKYYYTPKSNPETKIPIVFRGRIFLYIHNFNRNGGAKVMRSALDRAASPSLSFDGPIFKARPPVDPKINKPKEIEGLPSEIPPAVGMMIAYLATTAMGPEAILRNMPVFRFWAADVGVIGTTRTVPAGLEVVPVRRPDPPTPVTP